MNPGAVAAEALRERARGPGRDFTWWAMALFILTEAAFFAYLIAGYFYLRNAAAVWPPEGVPPPELRLALINTGILLLSSLPMHWGLQSIRKGRVRRLQVGLLVGFALGVLFLGIQMVEYHHKEFGPTSHAYGSAFFTITGFHAAHVLVGLIINLFTQARAARRHFDAERWSGVEACVLYWHFVDVVWLGVFSSLYLTPHLL